MGKNESVRALNGARLKLLSSEELNLIREVRKLRKEEDRWASIPPELLIHGWLTPAKAAQLLGGPGGAVKETSSRPKLPVVDGKIPTSEVLREFKRIRRGHLDCFAHAAKQLVRANSVTWFLDIGDWGYGYREIASRLDISKAAAKRLMDESGPLFTWSGRRNRGWVSPEELAAYERQLGRPVCDVPGGRELRG